MIKLFLFGTPRLMMDNEPVKLKRRKSLALLCYLAARPQPTSRDVLAALLWEDYDQERARSELRVSIHEIKKALGNDGLIVSRESVQINRDTTLWVDVLAFQSAVAAPLQHDHSPNELCVGCMEHYEVAHQLYTDDFLAGFHIPDATAFETWQAAEMQSLKLSYAQVLKRLVWGHCALQAFDIAQRHVQRWQALDPFDEDAHRGAMLVAAWVGNKTAALQHYHACQRLFEDELGVPPSDETTALYEALVIGNVPPPPVIYYDSVDEVPTVEHRVPHLPRPFRGRQLDVQQVMARILAPDCQLLTITGLGGAGKTYLSLQVARQVLTAFEDGVFFVSLVGAATRYALITNIADTVGFQFASKTDVEAQLISFLRTQKMLLVLDNFEHLLEHRNVVESLLQADSQLKILVTSRLPLNLKAEFVFTLDQMIEGATALFIDSATRADATFAPTADDQSLIGQICERLAGVPLAIELAATWVRVLSLSDIYQEVGHNVESLMSDWADVPARHRSLQATFEYSWQLLTVDQQQGLAQLAIFPSNFSYEAAKSVTNVTPTLLSSLSAQQLVKRTSMQRYEIHALVRQFALAKLQDHPTLYQATVSAYLDYYNRFFGDRTTQLRSESLLRARDELLVEIDSIRFACTLSIEQNCPEKMMDAVSALAILYDHQGWYQEGRDIFRRFAYIHPPSHQFSMRVKAFLGRFERLCGDYEVARRVLMQVIAHASHYPNELAYAYLQLYHVDYSQNHKSAMQNAEKALEIYQELDDRYGMSAALYGMAIMASYVATIDDAIEYAQQALKVIAPLGKIPQVATIYYGLNHMYSHLGNFAEALNFGKQSVELYEHFHIVDAMVLTKVKLASVYNRIDDYESARILLEECIATATYYQLEETLVSALLEYGTNAGARKDYRTSIEVSERALALSEKLQLAVTASYLKINLAVHHCSLGNYSESIALAQQAIQELDLVGNDYGIAVAYQALGEASIGSGAYEQAAQAFRTSIQLAHRTGIKVVWLSNLVPLGWLYYLQNDPTTALFLIQAVLQDDAAQSGDRENATQYLNQIVESLGQTTVDDILGRFNEFDVNAWLFESGILTQA